MEDPLVERAREGDRKAFEDLYRSHHQRVYAIALRLTREAAAAEELTQEVFVRAWRSLPGFNGNSTLATWLHGVAVNASLERARRLKRRRRRFLGESDLDQYAAEIRRAMPEAEIDLERAIAALPDGAREMLILFHIEGMPQAEIAERMDVTVGTVKSQIHRARRLIKEALG